MDEHIYQWIDQPDGDGFDLLSQFKKMVEGMPNSRVLLTEKHH
jgi:hypothetical protein